MIIYTAENIERIAPAFDDWDGDGLTDILTGSADGGLRLFLNRGTAKEPRYMQSVLKDFSYETDVDGYSVPLFADLNGDGKKDLLTGSITGKIRYYQSRTDAEEKRALWSMSDNLLNYYAPVNYGSHSSVVLADVNGDNAADMITGEADGTLNLYINENKHLTTSPPNISFPTLSPELGDLNGDSFPDMLVCNGDGNLIYFRHNADRKNPAWILESYSFYNIRNTGRCAVRLIDFDRDSDLDLFTADSEGNMVYYENIGDKKVPKMIEADFPYGEKNFPKFSVPAFMDWRQNGVPSMIFGTADAGMYVIKDPLRSDYLRILANTKRGENTDISRYTHYVAEEIPYIRLNGTQGQLIPYTADYNSDGKTDLLIGTDRGEVLAYINVGYEQFEPLKQVVIEQVSNLPPVFDSGRIIANTGHKRVSLSVGDLDGDYDNDLVYGDDKGDIYWLRNSGDQFEFNFLPGDTFLLIKTGRQNVSPVLYDIDRDSDLDIIAGSKDGEFMLYENTGDRKNHSFTPVNGAFQNIRVSRNAVPAAVYLGGQGVSLIAGDILGKLSILRGTRPQGKNWRFELLNRISLSTDVGIAAAPFIGDMNIDGIPEIIIGSDSGRLTVLQSQGSFLSGAFQGKPDYVPRYNFPAGTFPALADTDDDSDADLLVGTMDGQIIYFNNTAVKEK
ncbi:hypothetical protein CHS0354_018409 [Potamilus streckersoni]|uniref:VCBS repeat-containing protein n=1 Tax=Potamilus streckersoni TaxID=2493646 RepID=A0AAE0TAH7_9BIVA|nr:hypothetical protein CHS0354_018409 [Potamilus streckersoni]